MCCTDWSKMRSLYSIETLTSIADYYSASSPAGAAPVFVWLDPDAVIGAGGAVENMMHSSGGNTMIAAMAVTMSTGTITIMADVTIATMNTVAITSVNYVTSTVSLALGSKNC